MGKILGYYVTPHPPIAVPEIGKGEEKKISKTLEAYNQIAEEISELKPEVLIFITPHGPLFRDAVAISNTPVIKGSFRKFGTPQVKFEENINMHLSEDIIRVADEKDISIAPITSNSLKEYDILCELDHGVMVPLYFIKNRYTDYEIVHITYSMLPKLKLYQFGMAVTQAVEKEEYNAVIIASGDLSHRLSEEGPYSYEPLGKKFDSEILELLSKGDVESIFRMDKGLIDCAGECGMRSFYILLGCMDGYSVKGDLLSYEGPFGVGYGVMRFDVEKSDERKFYKRLKDMKNEEKEDRIKKEDIYVRLARESLENYIKSGRYIEMPSYIIGNMLAEKRGVFVSLKKEGELRGCIGTIFPSTENLASEIIRNAVEAGEHDPRFYPVEEEELEDIDYSVDVLMPPEKAQKNELDPKKYGVIVRKGNRAGLLLPDLEGVETVEEQLGIALSKAGIEQNEDYTIEKFEVIRHR